MPKTYEKQLSRTPAKLLFGLSLRHAREQLNLSQEALAELAGLHRTYIGQVENGRRNISIDNMEHLALAVGKELWEMIKPSASIDG
ncbi:helix-turn-helix transcriptional regulator [Massilia sp. SR12]